MSYFTKIDGEAVVLVSRGVYKHVDLYSRDGFLFAAYAGGYVRLHDGGGTSKDKLRWDFISLEERAVSRMGYLCLPGAFRVLEVPRARQLAAV
jgi:hypothetical protein